MFGAALALGGAGLVSGYMGGEAAEDAAHEQSQAALASTNLTKNQFNTTRADLAPYRDAGKIGLEQFMWQLGIPGAKPPGSTPTTMTGKLLPAPAGSGFRGMATAITSPRYQYPDGTIGSTPTKAGPDTAGQTDGFGSLKDFATLGIEEDPGYQFRKQQGEKALTYGASSRGTAQGTPGLKDLMKFNQGLASEEFNAAYMRRLSPLMTLMDTGQNASAMTGSAGASAAAAQGQAMMAGANAGAAGTIGSAGAWNNAIQGTLGNVMYQSRYNDMMKNFSVFGPTQPQPTNWNATGGFQIAPGMSPTAMT